MGAGPGAKAGLRVADAAPEGQGSLAPSHPHQEATPLPSDHGVKGDISATAPSTLPLSTALGLIWDALIGCYKYSWAVSYEKDPASCPAARPGGNTRETDQAFTGGHRSTEPPEVTGTSPVSIPL